MKILIYSRDFAPSIGGIESFVMLLARSLAALEKSHNLQITVATVTPAEGASDGSLPFKVIRCPRLKVLLKEIRNADIVHLAGPAIMPMIVGLLLGKPLIVEHHGFQAICPNGQYFYAPTRSSCEGHFMGGRHTKCLRCTKNFGEVARLTGWLLTFVRRGLCRLVLVNITPTDWLGTLLRLPRVTTIHHGVGDSGSHTSLSSVALHKIAFVGRLVDTKGVETLIEATALLKSEGLQILVKIIGDGPRRSVLLRQAVEFGVVESVRFLGFLPANRLEQELNDVSTLVVPSLSGEVFGLVAAEGMVRGKSIVYSDIGPFREVVADGGLRFPAGDAVSLAACLRRVLNEPGLAESIGRKARQRALSQFRAEQALADHIALYRKIDGYEV